MTIAAAFSAAAAEPPLLTRDEPLERAISGDERHEYRVRLKDRRYLLLRVDQRGVDVVVRIYGPDGAQTVEVDVSGATGPEMVTFFNRARGVHRVEIAPFDRTAPRGRYEVRIDRLERAARSRPGQVRQLMAPLDRPDSPGAAVAVARGGKLVFSEGFGSAQLEYQVPITPQTVFHVASVSKQFTAFAVVLLAQRGALSLDDDVRMHLPEVPDFGTPITLRQLIHHTSGLRDQWSLLALAGWRLDDVITRDQIMTLVRNQRELNFKPGEEQLYCNTGYTLLAETVARVTKTPFPRWLQENVFAPLGMTRTHFHDDHERIVPNRAYSYASGDAGFRKSVLSYANVGATSLFTTVEDLARWSHNFDSAQVGDGPAIEQMLQRGRLNDGSPIDYAFGLVHREHRGLPTVGHSGGDAGFRSHLVRYPDQGLAVVVLSNLGSFNPAGIARRVAEIYLDDEMTPVEVSRRYPVPGEEQRPPLAAAEADTPRAALTPEVVAPMVTGVYRFASGLIVTVWLEGERLVARTRGQPEVELVPVSISTLEFVVPEIQGRVKFHAEESGGVRSLTLFQGGQELEATEIEPFEPTVEQLAGYAGRYISDELGTFYRIEPGEAGLIARHFRHGEIVLTPVTHDEFSGDRWFFDRVRFERDETNAIRTMLVSSGRVRNLRFERRAD